MNVEELIERLKQFDYESEVYVKGETFGEDVEVDRPVQDVEEEEFLGKTLNFVNILF